MEQEKTIQRNLIILAVATFLLVVIITTGWFLLLVRPQKENITKAQANYDARKSLADGLSKALAAQRKSEDELNYVQGQMAFLTGTASREGRFRSLYFGDISASGDAGKAAQLVTWHRWLNEYYTGYGDALSAELIRIARASGVVLKTDSKIQVDAPPRNPEDVKPPAHSFMLPLSNSNGGAINISITGDLPHILQFFDNINQSSILMVVGTIKLEGYSPTITAKFPLTPYLLASGPGATISGGTAPANNANNGAAPGEPAPEDAPPAE